MLAQLPLGIKGLYLDGWKIQDKKRIRSMEEFLATLRGKSGPAAARDFGNDETARQHTKSVLNVVKRHVETGEIQNMIDQFPMELTELWWSE